MSDSQLHSCHTLQAGLEFLATNCVAEVSTTMDLDAMIAVLWLLSSSAQHRTSPIITLTIE